MTIAHTEGGRSRPTAPAGDPTAKSNVSGEPTATSNVPGDRTMGLAHARPALADAAWMPTASGRRFTPLAPRVEDIDIVDIAHGLSNICRYGGHTLEFYSVAQHSVLVSEELEGDPIDPARCLWGLLHDATEAYLGDVITPLKAVMPEYQAAEALLAVAIAAKFVLPWPMPSAVKVADLRIVADERRSLMAPRPEPGSEWGDILPGFGLEIEAWTPEQAREAFLARFKTLASAYAGG